MVDLGTMGGFTSVSYAVNNNGQVAGMAEVKPGLLAYARAFRWTDGNGNGQADPNEMIDLGTLSGGASTTATARGINNHGGGCRLGETRALPDGVLLEGSQRE